jgi:hypothetical protein
MALQSGKPRKLHVAPRGVTCIEILHPCALSQTCDTLPERFYPYLLQLLVCRWQRWKLEW